MKFPFLMRNDFQISAEFHEAFSFSAYGLDVLCSMPSTFVPNLFLSHALPRRVHDAMFVGLP